MLTKFELRHYVALNVIAATKIVKKHDKHAGAAFSRRTTIGTLVHTSKGINECRRLQGDLTSKLRNNGGKPTKLCADVHVEISAGDNDEESEQQLRALPQWLLTNLPEAQQETGQNATEREPYVTTFYTTFLEDWSWSSDQQLGQSLLGGRDERAQPLEEGWDVEFKDTSGEKPWGELDAKGRCVRVALFSAKITAIIGGLYLFICCLSFLADGFRLLAGRQAGEIFRNSEVFNNPIAGMLVGVLVTVLVQSSSTSTSIVITMVAADLLNVQQAISLVMGANIGTSVTSTIVAISQSGQKDDFRRAFGAATVHDMFNFLTVALLLPIEAATGYLRRLSGWFISLSPGLTEGSKPPDMLKALTKPFTSAVVSVDKKLISKIAAADTPEAMAKLEGKPFLKKLFGCEPKYGCELSDGAAGVIVLISSLLVLCLCLMLVVAMLKSILKGRVAVWLHRVVNGEISDLKCRGVTIPMGWLSGYLAIVVGMLVTIAVQSSSITTSALTPLVGVGVIKLERMYPTVLGANIGTCITGVLAALAADAAKLYLTLQVAYAHLLFNISGIVVFYCIWPLRTLPISAAKFLGDTTAEYRWFAPTYIFVMFLVVPTIFFGCSLAGTATFVTMITLALSGLFFVFAVNFLQAKAPWMLPRVLRDWLFLPAWMRSLEPMDRLICLPLSTLFKKVCCKCLVKKQANGAGGVGDVPIVKVSTTTMPYDATPSSSYA